MYFKTVSIGTNQSRIVAKQPDRTSLVIFNNSAAATIYIGSKGQDLNGFPIKAGGSASFKIPEDDPSQEVWAISDGAGTDVRIYEGYGK